MLCSVMPTPRGLFSRYSTQRKMASSSTTADTSVSASTEERSDHTSWYFSGGAARGFQPELSHS